MSKVFNWQLNREMEHPYEESRPDKQFAAVFNINRCRGGKALWEVSGYGYL